jgi:hypothetical protein
MILNKDSLNGLYLSTPINCLSSGQIDSIKGLIVKNESACFEASLKFRSHFVFLHNLELLGSTLSDDCVMAREVWTKVNELYSTEVFDRLKEFKGDVCLLKSFNLFNFVDTSYAKNRFYSDFDLLVKKDSLEETRAFFLGHGFIHGNDIDGVLYKQDPNRQREDTHYEITPLYKPFPLCLNKRQKELLNLFRLPVRKYDGEDCLVIKLDIHKSISYDFSADDLWNSLLMVQINGVLNFRPEDLAWYISLKLYYEVHGDMSSVAMRKGRNLIDIVSLINNASHMVFDWDYFYLKIIEFDIQVPIFYVFSTIMQVFEVDTLKTFLYKITSSLDQRYSREKDHGPFLLKLLGEKPQNVLKLVEI